MHAPRWLRSGATRVPASPPDGRPAGGAHSHSPSSPVHRSPFGRDARHVSKGKPIAHAPCAAPRRADANGQPRAAHGGIGPPLASYLWKSPAHPNARPRSASVVELAASVLPTAPSLTHRNTYDQQRAHWHTRDEPLTARLVARRHWRAFRSGASGQVDLTSPHHL